MTQTTRCARMQSTSRTRTRPGPGCHAVVTAAASVVALAVSLSAPARAQEPAAASAAAAADGSGAPTAYDARSLSERGFVAVERSAREEVPGGTFMLAGYLAFLLLLGAYVARLAAAHRATQEELRALRRAVEDLDDKLEHGK
jgi:hypothetical protein